jgi:uncharacterized protein
MSHTTINGAVLITGASTGIGAVYADRLAKRGLDLILVARDKDRLDALAARLRIETDVRVEVIKADLTDRTERLAIERRLRDDEGVGALVNNAGLSVAGPLVGGDPDRLESIIDLNITAAARLAIAAATGFAARGGGLIVNLASVLALAPEMTNGYYAGSKAFILNLGHSLAQELAGKNVRIQTVLPGATRTEIWERSGRSADDIPAEMLMDVDEMVDAAMAGLDAGERVTIPSLPDPADWEAFETARANLRPNLSRDHPARRYRVRIGA